MNTPAPITMREMARKPGCTIDLRGSGAVDENVQSLSFSLSF
jgi:hypothetical protein